MEKWQIALTMLLWTLTVIFTLADYDGTEAQKQSTGHEMIGVVIFAPFFLIRLILKCSYKTWKFLLK